MSNLVALHLSYLNKRVKFLILSSHILSAPRPQVVRGYGLDGADAEHSSMAEVRLDGAALEQLFQGISSLLALEQTSMPQEHQQVDPTTEGNLPKEFPKLQPFSHTRDFYHIQLTLLSNFISLPQFAYLKSAILNREKGISYWYLVGRGGQDSAKHPTKPGTAPATKNDAASNVSCVLVENS